MPVEDVVTQQQKYTAQSSMGRDDVVGVGFLYWMAQAGALLPPWWSKARDQQLRVKAKESNHFMGAVWTMSAKLTAVPFQVEPRDNSVNSHIRQSDEYQSLLEEGVQFGGGWERLWTPFLQDLWTMDNGAFMEVIGAGKKDGPIRGPVLGLAHLDSYRCNRTSNPEFPVIYEDTDGKRYKFHHTRVIHVAQLPSPNIEMNGVGHCWLTRCADVAQNLVDIAVYKQEKLGSRPIRGIMKYRGGDAAEIIGALRMAEESMDDQGLRRFAKMAVIGLLDPASDLEMMDLASLPDGFDEETATRLGMYVMALAGGFPPRWLWPATTVGATKADAMYQHVAGSGGGAAWHLNMMRRVLGGSEYGAKHMLGKVLPPHLKLVFDYQDDEQDRLQSEIRGMRAKTRADDINDGVMTVRVARERALADGDLTDAQFEQLELEEGRLPNGDDVLTLFLSADDFFIEALDLGVSDPLIIDGNDPLDMMIEIEAAAIEVQDVMANAASSTMRDKAKQALSALGKLKGLYQKMVVQDVQGEMAAEAEQGEEGEEAQGEESEQAEGEQPQDQEAEQGQAGQPEQPGQEQPEKGLTLKQFNFGAGVGEVIRGNLARGEGGKFANAAEVEAQKSEILQRLLGRLKARRAAKGKKGGGGGAAEAKREANREKVAEELAGRGLPANTVNAMVEMRGGEEPDPDVLDRMVEEGLAQVNPDGTATMTPEGRSVLTAANTGDIDKVNAALQKVKDKRAKDAARAKKRGRAAAAKKPVLTPEEREAERQAKREQTRGETFDALAEQGEIERADLDALNAFSGGGELDPASAQRLAREGLVEFGTDGTPRLTGAARTLLSAAERGDSQRANDAASRARDQVAKVEERLGGIYEQMEEADADTESKVAALEAKLDRPGSTPESNAAIEAQIEQVRANAEERRARLQKRADELRQRYLGSDTAPTGEEEQLAKMLPFEVKSVGDYRANIRAAVRAFWNGYTSYDGFFDMMIAAIRRGLTQAWEEGIAECGFQLDELSAEERMELETMIYGQIDYIGGFAEAIEAGSKANGGQLTPLFDRSEMWINRYNEAKVRASSKACANKKKVWILGPTEHCRSCAGFEGRVYRYETWASNGALPQTSALACHGINCQCRLDDTEERITPGRFPASLLGP